MKKFHVLLAGLVLGIVGMSVVAASATATVIVGDPGISPVLPEPRIEFTHNKTTGYKEVRFTPFADVGAVEFFISAQTKYPGQIGLRFYTGGTIGAVPVLYHNVEVRHQDGSVSLSCAVDLVLYGKDGLPMSNLVWGNYWWIFQSARDPYRLEINICVR